MHHYPDHLIMGVAALAATLLIIGSPSTISFSRKLQALVLSLRRVHPLQSGRAGSGPDSARRRRRSAPRSSGSCSPPPSSTSLVYVLINPLRANRVPDAFPSILQDAIVIGLLVLVATFVFQDKLLTTSAVGAVVVGFALQDTLGNAFAGLGIQSEKPFRVGHWIRVGDFEGRVAEVTWRATKLRTKSGNFVVVPNNIIAKEAITNYSEPAVPTRLEIDVGASYLSTPADVKAGDPRSASLTCRACCETPSPDALLHAFDGSAITYRVRFWIADYEFDEEAQGRRANGDLLRVRPPGHRDPLADRSGLRARVARAGRGDPAGPSASTCWPTSISLRASVRRAAPGDCRGVIDPDLRQRRGDRPAGAPGHSMFVVCSGAAVVVARARSA